MTRARNAAITAAFSYVQYALAIASGFVLVPLTLAHVGARPWGLWLASGEILNYAGMVDLGILAVLPWMLAEADGRGDRDRMRRLVSQGVWIGAIVGVGYVAVAAMLWRLLPSALFLTPADRALVAVPLAVVVVATMLRYPLAAFRAVLTGLQDVVFNGFVSMVQAALSFTLTVALLLNGYGLFALAYAAAVPPLVALAICAGRVFVIAPDLRPAWVAPSIADLRPLVTSGVGMWLGDFGWQLLAASNAIIITYMGHPEWVPVYGCTAKLSSVTLQLAWVLPDSGHVGLVQLQGESDSTVRVGRVVALMLRLHLVLAGAAACGLLAFNPAFVTRWVGAALFGGLPLNGLLAFGVVFYSLIHGIVTAASVLGNRMRVGIVVLANGVLQALLAIVLGHRLGLIGVAWAGLIAGAITSLPAGILLLRSVASVTVGFLTRELIAPWATRAMPIVASAAIAGFVYESLGMWMSAAVAAALCGVYLWRVRPFFSDLPIDPMWSAWLVRLGLLPAAAEPAMAVATATGEKR